MEDYGGAAAVCSNPLAALFVQGATQRRPERPAAKEQAGCMGMIESGTQRSFACLGEDCSTPIDLYFSQIADSRTPI